VVVSAEAVIGAVLISSAKANSITIRVVIFLFMGFLLCYDSKNF
jgi:hypothetical protein